MVRNNKEYLEERLDAMGFEIVPSQAISFVPSSVGAQALYEALKERKYWCGILKGPCSRNMSAFQSVR